MGRNAAWSDQRAGYPAEATRFGPTRCKLPLHNAEDGTDLDSAQGACEARRLSRTPGSNKAMHVRIAYLMLCNVYSLSTRGSARCRSTSLRICWSTLDRNWHKSAQIGSTSASLGDVGQALSTSAYVGWKPTQISSRRTLNRSPSAPASILYRRPHCLEPALLVNPSGTISRE